MTGATSLPPVATAEQPGSLERRTVLVARAPERAEGLVDRLRAAGATVLAAPVIERAPADDEGALDDAARGIADGRFAWVVVTSVNAVDALVRAAARTGSAVAGGARWAAVGPTTRRALEDAGIGVDLVPDDEASGAGLVAAFPPPGTSPGPRRVLLPLGDLAAPTLHDGLEAMGWAPEVVTAYRTVPRDLPGDVAGRPLDAVVVTSGSVAREIARQLGTRTPVVAIGRPSAATARAAGLRVAAVAAQPTDDALAAAVVRALSDPDHARPHEEPK